MHPNPAFRQEPEFLNLNLARKRGFGTLCMNGDPTPMLAHVPFSLNEEGSEVELHLVRSNPIARAVTQPMPAIIAISGPDGYISPDWYEIDDQVPTWNYVAVHLRGTLHPLDHGLMRGQLDRLSAHFEARLAPKRPWTTTKMSDEALERLMRQILPYRFVIEAVDGTWKLGQNKTDEVRARAGAALRVSPIGHEVETLAALMYGGVPEIDKGSVLTYI